MPRARAGLPQARARGVRPRGQGLDARQHRAGRDRERGARLLRYYVHEKGDWEAAKNMIDIFSLEINARNDSAGAPESLPGGLRGRLGRISADRHQGADRRWTRRLSRAGLDGVLLAWPRYEQGMREFRDVTYPLVQAGGTAGVRLVLRLNDEIGGYRAKVTTCKRRNALLTDLYQLNMMQAYLDRGETEDGGVRVLRAQAAGAARLPDRRRARAGARLPGEPALLAPTSSTGSQATRPLRQEPASTISPAFRFTGDVHAMPEGTVFFANEPILRVDRAAAARRSWSRRG